MVTGITIDWQAGESSNEGNFIQLVCFRAEIDTILSAYLSKAPKNAPKTIQNELLSVVGDNIRNSTIREVKSAKYSIIADEVTNAANNGVFSCLSLCLQVRD